MIKINVLVLNSGSSSLKYQLINMKNEKTLAKGICEKIGSAESALRQWIPEKNPINKPLKGISDHTKAFACIEDLLTDKTYGAIKSIDEIDAVGHRVVHGGEYFRSPALINSEVINEIESLIPLAPLHNAAHLSGILACREMLGTKTPQIAVFDTSFYFDIPKKAYMFPLPYEYYEKYHIRKYGFHGTSHRYVCEKYCQKTLKNMSQLKIISCHLGNGSSITAVDNGKAVENSMGLTPLGGVMMGTRSGSIDPSVILHIAEREHMGAKEISEILNKRSGLLGISGICSDDRMISEAEKNGNKRAALAHEMMVYQITQYIGAYTAVLKGCDSLIFTGGIGENQWIHREKICKNLEFTGLKINEELNRKTISGAEGIISTPDSKIEVAVIPTNEELAIARETLNLIKTIA